MDEELYSCPYGVITLKPDKYCLEMTWFDTTHDMTDEDLKRILTKFADMVEIHMPRYILFDVRHFAHLFGKDVAAWRQNYLVPRYNEFSVKKCAVLMRPEAIRKSEALPKPLPGSIFPFGCFPSRARVEEWFEENR